MNTAGDRGQEWVRDRWLAANPALLGVVGPQAVYACRGCDEPTMSWRKGVPMCPRCAEEVDALEPWWNRRDELQAEAKRAAAPAPAKWTMDDRIYAAATVAALCWLLWEFRGFFAEWVSMWIGGGR